MVDIRQITENVLKKAKEYGADDAQATYSREQQLLLYWNQGKPDQLSSSGSSRLSMKFYVNGRYGSYSTSDIRDESLDKFIQRCVLVTRELKPNPFRTITNPRFYQNRREDDLDLYDPAVAALTPSDAIETCKEIEALAFAHKEVNLVDITSLNTHSISEKYTATTNGFSGYSKNTFIENAAQIIVSDGETKQMTGGYTQSRHLKDLIKSDIFVSNTIRLLSYQLNTKKIPSGKRTIILNPIPAEELFHYYLQPLLGSYIVDKDSYFIDQIGKKLASDLFDLHNDPWLKRGLMSQTFDDDCISTKPLTLFEKGTLNYYMLDVYNANRLSLEPTTGEFSNVILTPGKRSFDEMIADVKDGIYVTRIKGGNQDNVSGSFSYRIGGVAIENGKLTHNIDEMNIVGNYNDFWQRLVEVGNDSKEDANYRIPTIRIDDVLINGS